MNTDNKEKYTVHTIKRELFSLWRIAPEPETRDMGECNTSTNEIVRSEKSNHRFLYW